MSLKMYKQTPLILRHPKTMCIQREVNPAQELGTFCLAMSASLQAELYISIVFLSSSLSLLISSSISSYSFEGKPKLVLDIFLIELYCIKHMVNILFFWIFNLTIFDDDHDLLLSNE